jgi:hypothetical protein
MKDNRFAKFLDLLERLERQRFLIVCNIRANAP